MIKELKKLHPSASSWRLNADGTFEVFGSLAQEARYYLKASNVENRSDMRLSIIDMRNSDN